MQKHSDSDNVWTMHAKIDQNKFTFLQILHLSSNRRVRNLTLYFQFTTPARELTHRTKFEHPERHEFWQRYVSPLPKARETPKILPRKTRILATPQFFTTLSQRIAKSNRERTQILHRTALIDPSKMPRKVFIFPESRTSFWNALINPIHTNQTTTWEHLVACFLNCRPIVTHSDSSTLAQDAVLNCYKKPAHYYYQFSDFFRRPTSSCVVF